MSNLVKLFYKKHGRHPAGNVQDEVSAYAATEIERLQDEVERLQDHADQLAELGAQQTQKTIKAEQERDQLKEMLGEAIEALDRVHYHSQNCDCLSFEVVQRWFHETNGGLVVNQQAKEVQS